MRRDLLRERQPLDAWALAWAGTLVVGAFAGAFGLHRYFDDWVVPTYAAEADRDRVVVRFLFSPIGQHWSPVWHAIEWINLKTVGWDSDAMIRVLTAATLACACIWFARVSARLALSRLATLSGIGVLALHHVNAVALYSFDTYAQCLADLVTWVVAGQILGTLFAGDHRIRRRDVAIATALIAVGVLTKEQALAAVASAVWLCALALFERPRADADRRRILTLAVAVVAVAGAFALARRNAGVVFDRAGPLRLCIPCAPANVATILGALALPVRTLAAVDAWRAMPHAVLRVTALAAATVAVLGFLGGGLARRWRSADQTQLVAIAGLLVASCFPTAVLGHVGELYAHTAVFWFALLVAEAVEGWTERRSAELRVATMCGGYLLCLAIGLRVNLADMRDNGVRASAWLSRYARALERVPTGGLALVHGAAPQRQSGDYSLYRLTTPEYLMLESTMALDHRIGERITVVLEWESTPDRLAADMAAQPGGAFDVWRRGDAIVVSQHGQP